MWQIYGAKLGRTSTLQDLIPTAISREMILAGFLHGVSFLLQEKRAIDIDLPHVRCSILVKNELVVYILIHVPRHLIAVSFVY